MISTISLSTLLLILLIQTLYINIEAIPSDKPIALHQLVSVDTAGDVVIRLKGWDAKNPKVSLISLIVFIKKL